MELSMGDPSRGVTRVPGSGTKCGSRTAVTGNSGKENLLVKTDIASSTGPRSPIMHVDPTRRGDK